MTSSTETGARSPRTGARAGPRPLLGTRIKSGAGVSSDPRRGGPGQVPAAGLVPRLFWAPIGIAAAAGRTVYLLLPILAHVPAGDAGSLAMPMVMAVLAAAALVLRALTS